MFDTEFFQELGAFITLCVVFTLIKLYHCCFNLGLVDNHKEVAARSSLDAKSFQNCKEASKTISRVHQKSIKVGHLGLEEPHVSPVLKAKKYLVGNCTRGDKVPPKQIRFHETKVNVDAVSTSLQ